MDNPSGIQTEIESFFNIRSLNSRGESNAILARYIWVELNKDLPEKEIIKGSGYKTIASIYHAKEKFKELYKYDAKFKSAADSLLTILKNKKLVPDHFNYK